VKIKKFLVHFSFLEAHKHWLVGLPLLLCVVNHVNLGENM